MASSRYGEHVQRLFSMFPAGIPGMALISLRLLTVALLSVDGMAYRNGPSAFVSILSSVIAFCLVFGVLTPYAALAAAVLDAVHLYTSNPADTFHSIVAVVISLSIAALGPGAYSVDCKIFGRHVVSLPSDKETL